MTTAVKVTAGLGIVGTCLWLMGPAIFNAMQQNDLNNLTNGMNAAKRRAGSYVHEDRPGKYESYMEKYVKGKL